MPRTNIQITSFTVAMIIVMLVSNIFVLQQQVADIQKLCKACGVGTQGSKTDLLSRLRGEMQTRTAYDKIFQKVWGASGICCALSSNAHILKGIKFHLLNILITILFRWMGSHFMSLWCGLQCEMSHLC